VSKTIEALKHIADMLTEAARSPNTPRAMSAHLHDLASAAFDALAEDGIVYRPCAECDESTRGYTATHCAHCAADEVRSYGGDP
jgi:hypothetical protein